MRSPGRSVARRLLRPLDRTRLGRSIRALVRPSSRGVTVPFGSVAPTTKGAGPILLDSGSIETRFLLLGEGRSGTTLLREELNLRWKEIDAKGEVFSPDHRDQSASFEQLVRDGFTANQGASIVGFKLFSTHATEQQFSAMLQLDGMRAIIIRRRNPLRRYVSEEIAKQTGRWTQSRSNLPLETIPLAARRITVDIRHLERVLQVSEDRYREFDRLTFLVPSIGVWYEDLVADLNGELRRIANFLGAGEPARENPPRLVRQNPEPLTDLIANYNEVSRFLHRAGKSDYLLDEDIKEARSGDSHDADPIRSGKPSQP